MKKILPIIFLAIIIVIFFSLLLFKNRLPIPADTIVGLYHPFRDLYAKDYPNGIAFKNFLVTDPVRQQYPWKNLTMNIEKRFELPLWNPYNFAGTPLLANFQSAAFYPLNLIFLVLPFSIGWSGLVLLQPLLAGVFLYLYLNNLKISRYSSIFGAVSFAFCGFSVAWLEWGTVSHTAIWLPLVLLSIDKIMHNSTDSKISNFKFQISNKQISVKKNLVWALLFLFSLTSSFFAGHLQIFFYLIIASFSYFLFRWFQEGRNKKTLIIFLILISLFLILTIIQWLPTLQFIFQSARGVDQNWQKEGWFIPWQNLAQFVAPDFFGNPTTLNYWGVWNYAEFIGYIGIVPLIMAACAFFQRREKLIIFFGSIFFLSLLFSLPTFFAMIPFQLQIPFISTAQPTRLLFLTDFSLAVLAALGIDALMSYNKRRQIIYPLLLVGLILVGLWVFVFAGANLLHSISLENLNTAKRNLYFPTIIFVVTAVLLFSYVSLKNKAYRSLILVLLLIFTVGDLLRFTYKFTPFTPQKYLYPNTKAIDFLQKQKGQFRIMTTDDRILPPNFSIMYQLQTLDGYDPLYLLRYGELVTASERGRPDIKPPFGFNRIVTPHNFESNLVDLMNVRFVLSLSEIKSPKLEKVFEEGQTKIYKNNSAFQRAFLVKKIIAVSGKQNAINTLFNSEIDLKQTAIVENWNNKKTDFAQGSVSIVEYKENNISVLVQSRQEAFLVLVDTFYPTWSAQVCMSDDSSCKEAKIYLTDYNFRGIVIPKGVHKVIFKNSLL